MNTRKTRQAPGEEGERTSRLGREAFLAETAQARQLLGRNRREEALAILTKLLKYPPTTSELLTDLGILCVELGEFAQAIEQLYQAIQLDEQNGYAMIQLALVYTATSQPALAEQHLAMAMKLLPDSFELQHAFTMLYLSTEHFPFARKWGEQAVATRPHDAAARINLANALANLEEIDLAYEHAQQALKLAPKSAQSHIAMGNILLYQGRKDEALQHISKALEYDPYYGPGYESLASLRKWTADDLPRIESIEALLDQPMDVKARAYFHFALGKMCDDAGFYDRAFEHFRKGNVYGKPTARKEFNDPLIQQQRKLCTRRYLASIPAEGTSDLPVFIVGMPRSGTTLLEQLIASHPHGAGAGELRNITMLTNKLFKNDAYHDRWLFPKHPDPALLRTLSEEYLAALSRNREDARRITDKMPENYHLLGTIALLFPRARIIHSIRHPLDTCLSCYFQMFGSLTWSYDIDWIIETYRRYRKTIAYWQKTLPPGRMIDVHYEQLVQDPEQHTRRILDHIGLDWDPACLEFFRSERNVRTASVMQVRQPIYQSSRGRWTRYAAHLQQLAEGLAPYLEPEDLAILREHGVKIRG